MMDSKSKNVEFEWVKDTISRNFGNVQINHILELGEGFRSKAFLINDKMVFRFPKEEAGAIDTEKEIKMLPFLNKQITLNIPEFIYCGKQNNGYPFVGYLLVQGEPMNERQFHSLSMEIKTRICDQIAEFIDQISSFNVKRARELTVHEINFYQEFLETFREVQEKCFPIINKELQDYISSRFTSYLENKNNFVYTPKLLHSDLSLDHLMFDSKKEELTGIIDFGDMRIGDPDYEYVYLLEECGEEITRYVMERRNEENIQEKLDKISFFLTANNVQLFLEGLKSNNDELTEEVITLIEYELENYETED
jgi:aminoglycoside 2''-phosphotransferase